MTAVKRRGVGLVECLVCLVLAIMLANILFPLFAEGLRVARVARRASETVHEAGLALPGLRRDLRQALTVRTSETAPAAAAALELDLPGGARLAYRLEEGRLSRWKREGGQASWIKTDDFAGAVAELTVRPVPGAARVWRIDLALRVEGRLARAAGEPDYHLARFATAAQLRAEGEP